MNLIFYKFETYLICEKLKDLIMRTKNTQNRQSQSVNGLLKKSLLGCTLALAFSLSSCGGDSGNDGNEDDNGGGSAPGPIVDNSGIIENLRITNLNATVFPWNVVPDYDDECRLTSLMDGKLKRWDIEGQGLIPVKTNGLSLVPEALNLIEERLDMTLFDRTSIANTPDEDIAKGIIFAAEEETNSYDFVFDNSGGCGNVSFKYETEYFYEDFELEYDGEGNIIGYDYPMLGQAYDSAGNVVGNILENTPYIFNTGNEVIGILSEEDWLLYNSEGTAICSNVVDGNPLLFDVDGEVIGTTVNESGGFFSIQGEIIKKAYYDASGMNGLILVRLDTMQCSFSDNEDEIEMIINKLGYALGLGSNFDGYNNFNNSGNFEINGNFWNVLNTLYKNPIGSDENTIVAYPLF